MRASLRIQLAGGIYYVSNDCYEALRCDESKQLFESLLFEACRKFDWELYGFLIGNGDYFLLMKLADDNLSESIKWLQGVFSVRYNKLYKLKGHVFRQRFNTTLIEPGRPLNDIIDFIHAKSLSFARDEAAGDFPAIYRWSSLHYFFEQKADQIPLKLTSSRAHYLKQASVSSVYYWKHYCEQLERKAEAQCMIADQLSSSWCYGEHDFKASLSYELLNNNCIENQEIIKEQEMCKAEEAKVRWMQLLHKTDEHAEADAYSSHWKLAIAYRLKSTFKVSNQWLTQQLNMGTAGALSNNLGVYERVKLKDCVYTKKINRLD